MNEQMQGEDPQFHKLLKSATTAVKTIMDCYRQASRTRGTDLVKVDYENPRCFVPLEDMYVGAIATAFLTFKECSATSEQRHFFRLRCLDFYIESIEQILKRVPFRESTLSNLEFLDPIVARTRSAPSAAPLARAFPNVISGESLQSLDTKWRILRNIDLDIRTEAILHEFWGSVFRLR
ncbi:hypothetical protein HPB47_015472 [Ixodes persulcatus]|uniref:Uncharacterized protein n=1 Tax=Ixodes persulcatus TaxID=34615 RepID=A0AC60QUA9_IXOPE|nr:hypothetical protein HPB47_015472 [Ixodes persulcatus]